MHDLLRSLALALPTKFLRDLYHAGPQIFAESAARTYGDPVFGSGSPEAHDLIGHERRALFEATAARLAAESGLPCPTVLNPEGTSSYRVLQADAFRITFAAVKSPMDRPRFALYRKVNARLNEALSQRRFAFMPLAQMQMQPDVISAIVLYGPQFGNPAEIGFIRFGIPSANQKRWIACDSIEALMQAQITQVESKENVEDRARPSRRRRAKGDGA